MIRGNKGEWSEIYVLLKLLAKGKIYAADDELNKIQTVFFPILKILRQKSGMSLTEYRIEENEIQILIDDVSIRRISKATLVEEAAYLYGEIIKGTSRAFEIPHMEDVMSELECDRLSAKSTDKTDITMQIHDVHTGYEPMCGFSIKSELGSAPTLLNASGATNFVYEVIGLSDAQIEEVNALDNPNSKIMDRMNKLFEYGKVQFVKAKNENFSTNLMLIDSRLEEIISHVLLVYYRDNIGECAKIIEKLESENPLNYPKQGFYEFKFKKFLCSVALGMMPSKSWDGRDEANGGYIIVTQPGEVLAYHIYNRNYFENYLFKNTRLDKGSTDKHNFASIYKQDGKAYINLANVSQVLFYNF